MLIIKGNIDGVGASEGRWHSSAPACRKHPYWNNRSHCPTSAWRREGWTWTGAWTHRTVLHRENVSLFPAFFFHRGNVPKLLAFLFLGTNVPLLPAFLFHRTNVPCCLLFLILPHNIDIGSSILLYVEWTKFVVWFFVSVSLKFKTPSYLHF